MGFTFVKYTYEQLYNQGKWSFLYMMLILVFLLLFFVFLALRVDQIITWNWIIVFTPLWMTLGIVFYSVPVKSWEKPWVLNSHFCHFINSMQFVYKILLVLFGIPIVVFTILLVIKLQYYPNFALFLVFIPLWIMDCMYMNTLMKTMLYKWVRRYKE